MIPRGAVVLCLLLAALLTPLILAQKPGSSVQKQPPAVLLQLPLKEPTTSSSFAFQQL